MMDFKLRFFPPGRNSNRPAEGLFVAAFALSQPFDFFDEAALFYRAILGLELHDNRELASPDGLVRSRAASMGATVKRSMSFMSWTIAGS